MTIKLIRVTVLSVIGIAVFSCDSFLNVDPPKSKILRSTVFESESSANLAVIAVYASMNESESFSRGDANGLTSICGLSADELKNNPRIDPYTLEFEDNDINATNDRVLKIWASLYRTIYISNAVIEGLSESTSLSDSLKDQLMGEVLFIRSFCHFYLVNIFGDIPLVLSTDYIKNSALKRTPKESVYEKIVDDLTAAEGLLPDTYLNNSRTRVNSFAATAMLARVYLYMEDWDNAELKASSVIENTLYDLIDLENVFLAESKEAIWQLRPAPVATDLGITPEAEVFLPPTVLNYNSLRTELVNSFELNDNRFNMWVGKYNLTYYPFKYKQGSQQEELSEHSMVMRLAEQYLIRAEARAWQDKLIGSNSAESDINEIRERAGLSNTPAETFDEIKLALEQERRVELFTEWGHRWFDLKRTNRADPVLDPLKARWNSTDALYPIPQAERNNNPNMNPQNPGY